MRLSLYGTLLDPTTLTTRGGVPGLPMPCRRAAPRDWRRMTLAGTLRRCAGCSVAGKIVDVNAAALRRLMAYEGPAYQLRRIVVEPRTRAWTWIAAGGTNHHWT